MSEVVEIHNDLGTEVKAKNGNHRTEFKPITLKDGRIVMMPIETFEGQAALAVRAEVTKAINSGKRAPRVEAEEPAAPLDELEAEEPARRANGPRAPPRDSRMWAAIAEKLAEKLQDTSCMNRVMDSLFGEKNWTFDAVSDAWIAPNTRGPGVIVVQRSGQWRVVEFPKEALQ